MGGHVILKPYYQVGQSTAARSVASNSASGEGAGGHTLVTLPRADTCTEPHHRQRPDITRAEQPAPALTSCQSSNSVSQPESSLH